MLKALSLGPSHDFHSALTYSREVLARPWPDLETWLVGGMRGLDQVTPDPCFQKSFVKYARLHRGSTTLEDKILAQGSPAAAFAYAAYGTSRRWSEAEPLILSGDSADSPALCPGPVDFLDRERWKSPWESQAVTYAQLFLKSGWPELEDKMVRGECHPQVAYEYAVKVLERPLPAAIENWLTLQPGGTKYQQKYIAFTHAYQPQPSPGSPSSPPP